MLAPGPPRDDPSGAIAEGDNARFARVVLPHLDDAYALALRLTRNRSDAEDVVQEACIRAFCAIAGFAEVNAQAWFLTIVRNTAYSWLSKKRSQPFVSVGDLERIEQIANIAGPDAETAETSLIRRVDSALLERSITELPPVFRETFMLRDVERFSYRRISKMMDVPVGTVMSRLARARRRLVAAIGSPRS